MTNHTAAIVIIGDEILSGRTVDTNTNVIAKALAGVGVDLCEARTIPDDKDIIIKTVTELKAKYNYIYTTGGIGPTHDDITSLAISEAFGVRYFRNPEAYEIVKKLYEARGEEVTPAREKMSWMPEGSSLILNPGTPPGFVIENVFVLAGVPSIMEAMLRTTLPMLKQGRVVKSRHLEIMIGESRIASMFESLQNSYPDVIMGSYPFVKDGQHGTSLVLRSIHYDLLDTAFSELEKILEPLKLNRY
jgi:molybdenum cofactor synthesis domain-containing protein